MKTQTLFYDSGKDKPTHLPGTPAPGLTEWSLSQTTEGMQRFSLAVFMFCCLVHKERTPILTSPNSSLKCFCQENEKETLQTIEGALNDLLKFKTYSTKTC